MRIPKTIEIKGKRWKIKRVKKIRNDDGEPWYGDADIDKRVIRISDEAVNVDRVFLHEVCHALLFEAGITAVTGGLTDLQEEIVCDAVADLMTTGFRVSLRRKKE